VIDEHTGQIEVRRIEVKGYARGTPIQLTVNEWYNAQQLAETYWLYVIWDPLEPKAELVRIQNPWVKLDHAKREIVASRFFEIPAEAINQHMGRGGESPCGAMNWTNSTTSPRIAMSFPSVGWESCRIGEQRR